MHKKFKLNNYEIITFFQNDNNLFLAIEDIKSNQYYMNQAVELSKIKKDTVFACFQRKSQKNLKFQIKQLIDEQKKYLVLTFIVSFDFLPLIKQEIKLQFLKKHEKLSNVSEANFQAQISDLQKIINDLHKKGFSQHQNTVSINLSQEKQVWIKQVVKGKYLLRVSGIYTDIGGNHQGYQSITFTVKQNQKQQKKTINCLVHSLYGYSYPFSFSYVVDCDDGHLKLIVNPKNANAKLQNLDVTLSKMTFLN